MCSHTWICKAEQRLTTEFKLTYHVQEMEMIEVSVSAINQLPL